MDAQNAVEPASTKPAASPKRPGSDPDQSKTSAVNKAPALSRTLPSSKEKDNKVTTGPSGSTAHPPDDDAAADVNSEAETIVLPGKDGHSTPKARKVIKHEDRSDGEDNATIPSSRSRKNSHGSKESNERDREKAADKANRPTAGSVTGRGGSSESTSLPPKKKRLHEKSRSKDGSSGLSSAPTSPPPHRARRSSNARSESDSESIANRSPKTSTRDKPRSIDKLIPNKRKAPKAESDDEGEGRKARRQRTSGAGPDGPHSGNRAQRDTKSSSGKPQNDPHSSSRTRSVSPHPRIHRRSISTQLPSQSSNGLSHKKKRIPAPLQSTDYHSDESSASGSPHPRSSKLRSLTTPATAESTVSPAKMAPHKKHLDAHGQTFLARACARGEYDVAKQRLAERPEDLDVADYAGNTPLQIAAINGCTNIVKLLIDAGCALDCVNFDKDTPLLDAVDNGHLEVVKLLLEAGVNPRKANVNGEEPLDRVNDDIDNAVEIRAALVAAKQKMGYRRRTSEDHHDHDAHSSHGPESPRRSPGAGASSHAAATTRRGGTVRSTKTSNHLLYMPMDDKTLRQAAGRGDEETVTRILQVRDTFDDPESMVAAARGGHDIVMQLLLALGKANPDPGPVSSMPPELATPMLAAIGQENLKVVRLLLDQNDFDPTRRFKGETYHEIARKRQGTNWKDEEHMLKHAYDEYKKNHKDSSSKTKSPNRRDQERDARRSRSDLKEESARSHKRKASSPSRDTKRPNSGKVSTSPRDKRRTNSFSTHLDDQSSPKRGPGRPRKEDRVPAIAVSDRETSPPTASTASKHAAKVKRTESDLAAVSSEGETIKPRRKLVSGRELKGEREKHRRASVTSNASSMKEPSSPHESRHDDPGEKQKAGKLHDRTKALKRDESRDRLSISADGSGKRHRSSATPPHHGTADKDGGELPLKRRRLDADNKEKRQKLSSSPDDRHPKSGLSRETSSAVGKSSHRDRDEEERRSSSKSKKAEAPAEHGRRESGKSTSSDKSIHVKSEDVDVEMQDAEPSPNEDQVQARELQAKEEERKRQAELEAQALERKKKEEEERRREEAEKRRKEEEEAKRREEEKRLREEEERKRKEEEEEERKRREEEERKRREEEERKRLEEEERRRREEEEARRREEEERKRKEEEERKRREEEERLRREQLEREAAEEARRKREEEERKERALREEMERRRRAAREAEQRRLREEQERIRLAKLPPLLRWLDQCPEPKLPNVAEKFSMMQGVRYDCIRPEHIGAPEGREQWLLNTQVALLLGEKDLELSRYTAWERIPVSVVAKKIIWRLEADRYALTTPSLYEFGKQLPNYYCGEDPDRMSFSVMERLRAETWEKFSAMDLFFIKASELMYIIPNIGHLRNVRLTMAYRELPDESQPLGWSLPQPKWKNDPDADRFFGFAPRNKYYVNGQLVGEEKPRLAQISKTPFPETRVPRRGGLVAASPDDPDYAQLCREQGLEHLLSERLLSPLMPNGVHSSPASAAPNQHAFEANGLHSPVQAAPTTVNGDGHRHAISVPASIVQPLVNGINGSIIGEARHPLA